MYVDLHVGYVLLCIAMHCHDFVNTKETYVIFIGYGFNFYNFVVIAISFLRVAAPASVAAGSLEHPPID